MTDRDDGHGMPRRVRLGFVYLSVLTLVLAGLSLLWTSRQVSTATARARAQCQFDADLGTAPLTAPPGGARPARFGVLIVSDARTAWRKAGCPGHLPAPGPSFTRWAAFYHLPAG